MYEKEQRTHSLGKTDKKTLKLSKAQFRVFVQPGSEPARITFAKTSVSKAGRRVQM